MTHAPVPEPTAATTPRILLPGIVPTLGFIAPTLFVLSWYVFAGNRSAQFFGGELAQTTLGTVLLLTGVGALLALLVLVGIRTMLQQQLDFAARIGHDRQPPRTDAG